MKNKFLLLSLTFLSVIIPVYAENEMFQKFTFSLNTLILKDSVHNAEYTADFVWKPEIFGYSDKYDLTFKPVVCFLINDETEVTADIKELVLSFSLSDSIEISAGRYIHDASFASFFSRTAFARVTDYQEILEGNPDSAVLASWLIEGTYYFGDLYLRASAEPFRTELPFFETDSVWFPNLGFTEKISSPFASDGVIELEGISITEPVQSTNWYNFIEDIGGALEFGGRLGPCDFLTIIYSGRDTVPLYSAEIILKNLVDDYSVVLYPVEQRIYAAGIAARGVIGPVVLYGESSFILNKPFIKETFYSTSAGFETESYTSKYIGLTVGGRWEWWETNLFITAEYTDGYILNEEPRTIMPFFQRMALLSLLWTPLDGQLSLNLNGVADIEETSFAVTTGIEYAPGEGKLSIKLGMPLFFGAADSTLGQYSDIIFPTISASILF